MKSDTPINPDMMLKSCELEKIFEWRKWAGKIPFIQFPKNMQVQIIPPHTGAMVRFIVKSSRSKLMSVYLDCHDILGMYGNPYWEAYPIGKDDTARFAMEDVDGLIACLEEELGK